VPRTRHREEAGDRALGEPAKLRARGEHLPNCGAVAAERDELDPAAPRLEHGARRLRRLLDQRPRLLVPPPAEAVRRRSALPVPAFHEPSADLRGDELLALEHADGIAAEADEEDADRVILGQGIQQGRQLDRLVFALVGEPEGRTDDDSLVGRRDPRGSVGIVRAARQPVERTQTLADVVASDVASQRRLSTSGSGSRIVNAVPAPGALSTSTSPPIACVSSRTIASPRPVPTGRSPL